MFRLPNNQSANSLGQNDDLAAADFAFFQTNNDASLYQQHECHTGTDAGLGNANVDGSKSSPNPLLSHYWILTPFSTVRRQNRTGDSNEQNWTPFLLIRRTWTDRSFVFVLPACIAVSSGSGSCSIHLPGSVQAICPCCFSECKSPAVVTAE
jgi:hypothetical protein